MRGMRVMALLYMRSYFVICRKGFLSKQAKLTVSLQLCLKAKQGFHCTSQRMEPSCSLALGEGLGLPASAAPSTAARLSWRSASPT